MLGHTQGSRAFKLQHKLGYVRKKAIEWKKTVFGKVEKDIKEKHQKTPRNPKHHSNLS